MEEERREFGEFLKHMRQSIGWSTTQMGKVLGVFRTTIVKWEKGEHLSQRDLFEMEQEVRDIVKSEIKNKRKLAS